MEWINNNKEILFSGLGVAIITWLLNFIFKKKNKQQKDINQSQKSGNNSTNYQAGRDIKL